MPKRTLSADDFAQEIQDRVDRLDGQLKGIFIVMNAFANELRERDPELAGKLANTILEWALKQHATEPVEEIVQMFSAVLNHGR
jgi:hypothetical protein